MTDMMRRDADAEDVADLALLERAVVTRCLLALRWSQEDLDFLGNEELFQQLRERDSELADLVMVFLEAYQEWRRLHYTTPMSTAPVPEGLDSLTLAVVAARRHGGVAEIRPAVSEAMRKRDVARLQLLGAVRARATRATA